LSASTGGVREVREHPAGELRVVLPAVPDPGQLRDSAQRLLDRLESHDTLTPDDVDPASASHDLDRPAKAVDAALTEPSALATARPFIAGAPALDVVAKRAPNHSSSGAYLGERRRRRPALRSGRHRSLPVRLRVPRPPDQLAEPRSTRTLTANEEVVWTGT